MSDEDKVNHPSHYTQHPSGIECIEFTEQMNFCLGNSFKYIFRRKMKNHLKEDVEKALWYLKRQQNANPMRIEDRKRLDMGISHVADVDPEVGIILQGIWDLSMCTKMPLWSDVEPIINELSLYVRKIA